MAVALANERRNAGGFAFQRRVLMSAISTVDCERHFVCSLVCRAVDPVMTDADFVRLHAEFARLGRPLGDSEVRRLLGWPRGNDFGDMTEHELFVPNDRLAEGGDDLDH